MGAPDDASAARFAAALLELEAELDWELLGRLHCWEGGEDFFGEPQRDALRDAGLCFAADVAEEIDRLPAGGPGRSLYVGPGVAELAPMLCERLVLGREVLALDLPGPGAVELNRALDAVAARAGLSLFRIATDGWESLAKGAADHGWLVSVLTDPEEFPALHDELYGRSGLLATGRGDLALERRRAARLALRFLDRLRPPALLTTTDEELDIVRAVAARRGLSLGVPERARLSAVVGDPVRLCRLERAERRAP